MKFNRLSISIFLFLSCGLLGWLDGTYSSLAKEAINIDGATPISFKAETYFSCSESLVHIVTDLGKTNGFCLKLKDESQVIVTCYRGIAGATSAKVLLAKDSCFSVDACLAYDAGKDLLILPIPDGQPLTGLQLASKDRENRNVTSYATLVGGKGRVLRQLQFKEESGKVNTLASDDLWEKINRSLEVVDECSRLGLTPSVRWLSSDICVQKENRGNPLIDFTGRVVGMNSWSRLTDKLTTHQTLPPSEIQPVLEEAMSKTPLADLEPLPVIQAGSKYIKSVEWLPAPRIRTSRSRRDAASINPGLAASSTTPSSGDRQRIQFYSGTEVTLKSLRTWESMSKIFAKFEDPFFGDKLNRSGKVEGTAGGTLKKADNLRFFGSYKGGLKTGNFYVWKSGDIPAMQCKYTSNKRDECCYLHTIQQKSRKALACLFLVEYEKGRLKRIHRFSDDGSEVLASYDSIDAMKANPNDSKLWEKAEAIEKNLKVAEYTLRRKAKKSADAAKLEFPTLRGQ